MPTPTSAQRGSLSSEKRQLDRDQPFFPRFKRTAHNHEPRAANGNGADGRRIPGKETAADATWWDKNDYPPLTSEGLRQWEMHAHVDHVFDLVPFWQRGIDAAERGQVLRMEEFLEKMECDGGWRTANEVLGMLGGWTDQAHGESGWGGEVWGGSQRKGWESHEAQRDGWGMTSTRVASDVTVSSGESESGWGIREEWAEDGPEYRLGHGNSSAAQDRWGARARVKMVQVLRGDGRKEELRHFVDAIARQEAVTEERRRRMHMFSEMPLEQKIQKIEEMIRILRTHG